jgi:hypothetical protein
LGTPIWWRPFLEISELGMRFLVAASLLTLATPAVAQDYTRPEIVRGLCQKDGCDEFTVLKAGRIRADEEGTLVQTRIRTYHSSSRGRVEKGEDTGFVFCSPTKPTILAQSDGKVAGFQIATAPAQETRETIRQQANFYACTSRSATAQRPDALRVPEPARGGAAVRLSLTVGQVHHGHLRLARGGLLQALTKG